jgi:hypothetical protein
LLKVAKLKKKDKAGNSAGKKKKVRREKVLVLPFKQ